MRVHGDDNRSEGNAIGTGIAVGGGKVCVDVPSRGRQLHAVSGAEA